MRPTCHNEGCKNPCKKGNKSAVDGRQLYKKRCGHCHEKHYRTPESKAKRNERQSRRRKPYVKFKKDYCEFCNFKAVHPCQLDVDHIDGNHKNNETDNLQTLCANCHRLKTFNSRDWEVK